jgi:thiamine-phosphate pyrophosphorylase
MKSKKRLLKDSLLYLIIDKAVCANRSLSELATEAADSGADIIQLRDKESPRESILKSAYAIRKTLSDKKAIFIVNDYIDIAKITDSDGVHLGQDDLSVSIARRILGPDKIIGVSCTNLEQARRAQKQGADYIGVGPIFATSTKPQAFPQGLNSVRKIKNYIQIPFFVLGGITRDNLRDVLAAGAKRVAVCNAICGTKNVRSCVKQFLRLLH